jgi:uncharacterized protein (DUF736 family)
MVPNNRRKQNHGHHDRNPDTEDRRHPRRRLRHHPGPIAIVPNANKASEEAPDYRVIHRKTGFEIGAGWNRIARQTGEEYLSVKLEAPEIGVIFGNLAQAPGSDPNKKVILWNNPN